MKLLLLPCLLTLASTSVMATPVNLMCTENGGTFTKEGASILEFSGTKTVSYTHLTLPTNREV